MLATNGPRWYDHRSESSWSSLGVSLALTLALFAAAITSMRTVSGWLETRTVEHRTPTVVRLPPPPTLPLSQPRPVERAAPAIPRTQAPTTTPRTIDLAPPIAPPASVPTVIAPPAPAAVPHDSARGTLNIPVIPLGPVSPRGSTDTLVTSTPFGAPIAPAGVTRPPSAPNTQHLRDSILAGVMGDARLWLTDKYKPKGAELAALQASQRVAEQMMRRPTSAGSQDTHVAVGKGLNGVGAVSGGKTGVHDGMVSIPFPLFSPGPSPEERKRNEKLDADYQARLRRLEARAGLLTDSLRADSLRRDSLAKVRARIVP